ncbi:MAG: response regulator [Leptolyngbyaceae cyanobacterium bins.302]|nr:response regulator [Leptolyngbyaceae cyanobacterium bins.302]
MQGKLSEIDIRSILQLIELGQRTGELFVEAYPPQPSIPEPVSSSDARNAQSLGGRFWFVFFLNGRIIYAADTDRSIARLRDYLRRYQADALVSQFTEQAIATTNAAEYGYLWALLERHTLTPAQGRSIIHSMVHETLFDLLSLHQGSFVFEVSPPLSPQLTTLEISPQLTRTMKQVQQWKLLHPYIQTPEQCPYVANVEVLKHSLSGRTFDKLKGFADGKTSLRQIARYLNRDILTVAKAIYPYVQQGVIQMPLPGDEPKPNLARSPLSQDPRTSPKVVCIDDGATVREMVQAMLSPYGYEVTTIENPLDALSLVFRLNPDLILCDIAMPELDGYEICAMLRTSTAFRQTPIVMLTGKDGFIDRVKARMVGATEYLTKPFGENELLMIVEKYAGLGYPERQQSTLLADPSINSSAHELIMNRTDATSTSSTPLN